MQILEVDSVSLDVVQSSFLTLYGDDWKEKNAMKGVIEDLESAFQVDGGHHKTDACLIFEYFTDSNSHSYSEVQKSSGLIDPADWLVVFTCLAGYQTSEFNTRWYRINEKLEGEDISLQKAWKRLSQCRSSSRPELIRNTSRLIKLCEKVMPDDHNTFIEVEGGEITGEYKIIGSLKSVVRIIQDEFERGEGYTLKVLKSLEEDDVLWIEGDEPEPRIGLSVNHEKGSAAP